MCDEIAVPKDFENPCYQCKSQNRWKLWFANDTAFQLLFIICKIVNEMESWGLFTNICNDNKNSMVKSYLSKDSWSSYGYWF